MQPLKPTLIQCNFGREYVYFSKDNGCTDLDLTVVLALKHMLEMVTGTSLSIFVNKTAVGGGGL